jgi:hypothetical protein
VGAAALMFAVLGWSASASGAGQSPSAAAVAREGNLTYLGGPVLHSSAPYLVFWTPRGERIPTRMRSLFERYFTDVAADSGQPNDVFGVLRQYYDRAGFADYRQTFDSRRQVIVDRQTYPPRDPTGCPDVAGAYPTCVSDVQVQSELQRLIAAKRLPTAGLLARAYAGGELARRAPVYFVVVPADVNLCQIGGTVCLDKNMCGYHHVSNDHGNAVLWAAISIRTHSKGVPHFGRFRGQLVRWPKVCQGDSHKAAQEPNRDAGDVMISLLSHEDSEMITDPVFTSWVVYGATKSESVLSEVGDRCNFYGWFDPVNGRNLGAFAPTLGGNASAGTLYDQLIHGHRYYTQSEWSNGNGSCEMRASPGRIIPRFTAPRRPVRVGQSLRFNPATTRNRRPLSSATWHFGDGSPTAFFPAGAALTSVKHRYRRPGRYIVTLTLVDTAGNLESTKRRVTVRRRAKPTVASGLQPTAS